MKTLNLLTLLFALIIGSNSLSATTVEDFTEDAHAVLSRYAQGGRVDYAALKSSKALTPLVAQIAAVDLESLQGDARKAFLINAYNVLVVNQAIEHYPLASVLDVRGFFDANKVNVGGRRLTLNQLEKDLLLKPYQDARLHFALVCGAVGCPPITDFAYTAEGLDAQLDRQTRLAVNDATFLRTSGTDVELSQIFKWYASDFGGSRAAVLTWINGFRQNPLATDAKVSYYEYDWALNAAEARTGAVGTAGAAANAARYVVSSTIRRGTFELRNFNNLYSQEALGERSTFFTSTTSALYGLTDRINVGLEARTRRVRYDDLGAGAASNFDVFSATDAESLRSGVSGFGPKVRIAPFRSLENFSIQSTYLVSVADDASGRLGDQRFFDFDGDTWITQFFNDFSVGSRFSVFTEVDLVIEDIGSAENGRSNRTSTPVTGIVSYFPNSQTTLYGLANYSPFYQQDFDYFYQVGAGAKYQFTPRFEVEVLATRFDNGFLAANGGSATTVNLGVRVNL